MTDYGTDLGSDFAARRVTMVDTQVRPSDVTKFPIISAMLQVPRESFVPSHLRDAAYVGEVLDLGAGRVMLDARTLAKMLDALDILPSEMVLDLGCGLGYSSAVIARMAEAVIAVEENADMASAAQARLAGEAVDNAAVITGPLVQGCAKHAPYDVIILQGGIETLPADVLAQLKDGGRIAAVFMEGALGTAKIGYKSGGAISWRFAFNAALPVLAGFEKQRDFAL